MKPAKPNSKIAFPTPIKASKSNNRVVWTPEMDMRFLIVAEFLGEQATPAKILPCLNIVGLTRIQVASHFQKYKSKQHTKEEKCETSCKLNPIAQNIMFATTISAQLLSTSCGNIPSSFSSLPLSGFCSAV